MAYGRGATPRHSICAAIHVSQRKKSILLLVWIIILLLTDAAVVSVMKSLSAQPSGQQTMNARNSPRQLHYHVRNTYSTKLTYLLIHFYWRQ